ncbi:MAG: hypothetical protein ABIN18_14375 [Pseudomonadota bacterium]
MRRRKLGGGDENKRSRGWVRFGNGPRIDIEEYLGGIDAGNWKAHLKRQGLIRKKKLESRGRELIPWEEIIK